MRAAACVAGQVLTVSAIVIALAWSPRAYSEPGSQPRQQVEDGDARSDPPQQPEPVDKAVEEPDAAAQIVIVEGQVTNNLGAGEQGVAVSVYRQKEDGGKGGLIATAVTDEIGDFKVTSPEAVHGDVIVTLSKPHYAETVRQVHLGDEEFPPYLAEELEG
ncbi:MAG: hypothetical protein ACYTFA_16485, partial [Planctomycetota bacterium]